MKKIGSNVYLDSIVGGCNVGFVTTKEGIVMIDTPIRPSEAMKWRQEIEKKGALRYIINTEEHADHCHNSCFFEGVLITSEETREKLSKKDIEEAVSKSGNTQLKEDFENYKQDLEKHIKKTLAENLGRATVVAVEGLSQKHYRIEGLLEEIKSMIHLTVFIFKHLPRILIATIGIFTTTLFITWTQNFIIAIWTVML